jgi:hypothetical protein
LELLANTGEVPLVRHAAVGVNRVNRLKVVNLVPDGWKQTEKNTHWLSRISGTALDLGPLE